MIHLHDIDKLLVEDIENPNHPSEYIAHTKDHYTILILRLPEVQKEQIEIISYAFVMTDSETFLYDRTSKSLNAFESFEAMALFLDKKIDILIKEIQQYHFDIDLLEESLYEDSTSSMFMQEWLRYKKDVSLIFRLMFHATLAFELFYSALRRKHNVNELQFADILEHMGRIRDLAKSAMEKLDNLYDFYRAKVDERMNRNVYYLTIISGIFLPLTLLTGFFGMNTGGLPLTDDPNGTVKVVWISLLLEVVMILFFVFLNSKKIQKFQKKR